MNESKAKGTKYLVLLIITLLLMFCSSFFIYIVAIPFKNKTGLSLDELIKNIEIYQNYFSTKPYNDTLTWAEYAQDYFNNNPILFQNIGTLFSVVQFLSYMPILAIAIYCLRKEIVEDFISFKKDVKNFGIIGIGLLSMYVLAIVVGLIYEMLGDTGESANQDIINLLMTSPGMILMVIAVVILAPISEELIFRKLLMGTCEVTLKLKPVFAIILSSLIFSFIHVSDLESLKYIFQYMALAVPICAAYHYSNNNIFVTIIMHMINNLISVLMVLTICF